MNHERIKERIAGIEKWLLEQDVDPVLEQAHLDEGTKARVYWHYGYMMALKDMQKAIRDAGAREK